MRSTLFYIPHQIGPLTLFGWGWVLLALLIAWVFIRWSSWKQHRTPWSTSLGVWSFSAFLVVIVLPLLESKLTFADQSTEILGLPIRGYGLMLLAGVVTGSYWTYRRGIPFGINIDVLFSLAFWGMIGGLSGARIFYVVQKWDEFQSQSIAGKLIEALRFTEGGLVVYGGMIGGLLTTGLWCILRQRSYLMLADIVTPPFLLGLALGRLGCLLNGCCYGGVCYQELPAIAFPPGSPPYMDQIETGALLDATLKRVGGKFVVQTVEPDGWAVEHGLQPGDAVVFESYPDLESPASPPQVAVLFTNSSGVQREVLPRRSLPVHPSQIYAAANAGLLSGLLATLALQYRLRGYLFAMGLMLYGCSRILEEFIRTDEAGQFGTMFSIGQWVSAGGILLGFGLLVFVVFRVQRTASPAMPLIQRNMANPS